MKTAFTPGPWAWISHEYYGYSCLWNPNTRQEVLTPGGQNDGDEPITWMGEELSEADCALIAAAPDLYEALERVTRIFGTDLTAWKEARRALTKARGESL